MDLRGRAELAARKVFEALDMTPTDEQARLVVDALEREAIEIVLKEREAATSTVHACCSPESDMAHKITDRIRHNDSKLIANLSALR